MNRNRIDLSRRVRAFSGILIGHLCLVPIAHSQEGSSPGEAGGNVIELSPFQVQGSENDIGYYAENTLAGSRLNTNVSDLAASITVVTMQQMEDTAATDINSMFLYEANAEGTMNYTDYAVDKDGAIQDYASGISNGGAATGPHGANRLRGLSAADPARNYFPSIGRIPFDTYNTRTFEINRGPNSILFGLGNAGGIVNQTLAPAMLGNNSLELQARVGSWDAFRASVDVNRTVIDDTLAVRAAVLYDETGFRRKPAYSNTRRQYLTVTYKPFERTLLRATFENYNNSNRRPNNVTPRDLVTPWREAGSPTWNPITQEVTIGGTTTTEIPEELWAESARPLYIYDRGELEMFVQRRLGTETTGFESVSGGSDYRTLVSGYEAGGPLSVAPGVTDQSLYDWERLNIVSGNFGQDKAKTYMLELDHEILPNLFLNLGWHREEFDSENSYYISQQTGATIQVDVNEVLLDGSPNPYFRRPFLEIREPDDFEQWENNENMRGTLAYELDLADGHDNWRRWLGRHTLMGLLSKREIDDGYYRWRQMMTSDNVWVDAANLSAGPGGAIYRRFYLGGTDGNVTYDPGIVPNGLVQTNLRMAYPMSDGIPNDAPFDAWNWTNESVTSDRVLHFVSTASEREVTSRAFVVQSYLWDDRIIGTFGWRRDKSEARGSDFPPIDPATGRPDPAEVGTLWQDWQEVSGNTKTIGLVVKPLPWLSFHYNESDNFTPAGVSYDIRDGSFLPLPNGEGEDYGVSVTLLESKLYARLNFFETKQNDTRAGPTGTFIWRMGRLDGEVFVDWATQVAQAEGLTDAGAISNRVREITQLPEDFDSYRENVVGTSDVVAEGIEFQLIYNPRPNWNIKFNIAQQETVFDNVAGEYDDWRATRLPVWQNARSDAMAAGFEDFWTYSNIETSEPLRWLSTTDPTLDTPEKWFLANVDSQMSLQKKLEGKKVQSQREWRWNVISNYLFTEGPLEGIGVGGAVRWEDEAAIGYLAGEPDDDGVVRQLDPNRPVYDDAQFHLDLWVSYQRPVLDDRAMLKLQINVRDVTESGELRPIGVNPDGTYSAYRIVDPRQVFFTTTLSF